MQAFENGSADEIGTGWVARFPARKGMPFIAQDKIKHLDAEQLQALVRDFTVYDKYADPDAELEVLESNGFTAIVQKKKPKKGTEHAAEHGYEVTFYFPLRDELIVLYASVYGAAEDLKILERICASFVPELTAEQKMPPFPSGSVNRVVSDSIQLSFSRDWFAFVTGTCAGKKVWGRVSRYDPDDKLRA